ncbi:MAG: glycosyltransferase family 4 protein [Pseudomonadota bacterium]
MRVLVHDYSGHPFQVQLTRELARRGWKARHVFSAAFQTPKGNLAKQLDDPETFSITPIVLKEEFQKNSFVKRRSQEIEQGRLVADEIAAYKPDIVISSNAPLDTQRMIWARCAALKIPRIFWVQDVYSEAISRFLASKSFLLNATVGAYYRNLEARMLQTSDAVVAISDGFVPILQKMGVAKDHITVIENWAPLDELPQYPRENDWTAANLPTDERLRIVYSGTLGLKHNPEYLLALAEATPEALMVICSEGPAVDTLKADPRTANLSNILFLPWVAFADLPKFLSGGDVLVVLLEEDAGIFSVPSKILTYCSMGQAVLGAIPADNLGAQILEGNKIGLTTPSQDRAGFLANGAKLVGDAALRQQMGANGRAYAERTFNITAIGDRFVQIVSDHTKGDVKRFGLTGDMS